MAAVADQVKEHVQDALVRGFAQADVRLAIIPASGNVAGYVVWPGFDNLDEKERLDRVWSVLKRELSKADQDKLSAIFAMTPDEFERTQDEEE